MKSLGNGHIDGLLLILLLPACGCLDFVVQSYHFHPGAGCSSSGARETKDCALCLAVSSSGPRVAKEDDSSCDPLFSHEAQHPMSDPSTMRALEQPGVVIGSVRRPMCNPENWNREAIDGLWCALK